MNESQLLRYSRHLLLNEFEYEFQEKLNQATILVIGCGGLANACLPILAGSGIGHIILCDDDIIDISNLPRQLTFTEKTVGQEKVAVLGQYLAERNSELKITMLNTRADHKIIEKYIKQSDVIVDCSDNAQTRQIVNRCAVAARTPLVSASVIQFSGQVMVFDARLEHSSCYACMYPTLDQEDKSCTQNGVFSPLVHVIGSVQAAEIIKILTGLGESSVGKIMQFEGLNFESYQFHLSKNQNCPVCKK